MTNQNIAQEPIFGISELAPEVLATYAHLWQFTWLRRSVYVQLRALDGDAWESKIKSAVGTRRPRQSVGVFAMFFASAASMALAKTS